MFGFFKKKKKSYLASQIEDKGLDQVTTEVAGAIIQQLSGAGYLYDFILSELDGASMGNEKAKRFARESGIPESEYKGHHQFEHPLIDGPQGAKTIMDTACLGMIDQRDLVVDFRLMTLDKLMRQIEFGKYDTENEQTATSTATFINSKGQATPIIGRQIEPNSRSLDGAEFQKKLAEFYLALNALSELPTKKSCTLKIIPCDGSYWSWRFELSDEESKQANEVISRLYDATQGWIIAQRFSID